MSFFVVVSSLFIGESNRKYMESSHMNNTGIATFANDCVFTTPNPAQAKNPQVRNSINGFPCLLYINDELEGVYTFNLDRYSTNSLGYDTTQFPKCLSYEISANSDTTAGVTNRSLYS